MVTLTKDKQRVPKQAVPGAGAFELVREIELLHAKLAHLLDKLIEDDARNCPGIPAAVLRGLRTSRHCYGFCACNWLRDEIKQLESQLGCVP
jgi:hypothetical protein